MSQVEITDLNVR